MQRRRTKKQLTPAVSLVRNFSLLCAGVSALAIVINFLFLSLTPPLPITQKANMRPCDTSQSCPKNYNNINDTQTSTAQRDHKSLPHNEHRKNPATLE